jgi:hypothetical protein
MKVVVAASAAVLVALLCAVPGLADPGSGVTGPTLSPPFVDHTEWTHWGRLASLRVYPTPSARLAARQSATTASVSGAAEAWAEVLTLSPDADTPGMRAQFICHWQFAEIAQPGKISWNLEPWRPVVDDAEMMASGCNPGGPEEPF